MFSVAIQHIYFICNSLRGFIVLGEKKGITNKDSINSKYHGEELYFYQQVMSTIVTLHLFICEYLFIYKYNGKLQNSNSNTFIVICIQGI